MPLDQLVIPDMTELYYAAVRALEYSEPSNKHPSDNSAGALRGACLPTFSHAKLFHRHGGVSSWLQNFLSHLAVSVLRGQTRKANRPGSSPLKHSARFRA
jgi:hypothetical protein